MPLTFGIGAGITAVIMLGIVMITGMAMEFLNQKFGMGVWALAAFPSAAWLGWKFFLEKGRQRAERMTIWLLFLMTTPFGIVIMTQNFKYFVPLFAGALSLLSIIGTKERKKTGHFDFADLQSAAITGVTSATVLIAFFATSTEKLFLITFVAAAAATVMCELAIKVAQLEKKHAENAAKKTAKAATT